MGCGKSKLNNQETREDDQTTIPERKIILIGDSAVGKTAIIHQYLLNGFKESGYKPTQSVKNHYITVDVPNGGKDGRPMKIKLDIWDTSGDDSMKNIMKMFY